MHRRVARDGQGSASIDAACPHGQSPVARDTHGADCDMAVNPARVIGSDAVQRGTEPQRAY